MPEGNISQSDVFLFVPIRAVRFNLRKKGWGGPTANRYTQKCLFGFKKRKEIIYSNIAMWHSQRPKLTNETKNKIKIILEYIFLFHSFSCRSTIILHIVLRQLT